MVALQRSNNDSIAGRLEKVAERPGLVGVLAHIAEHGKEIIRLQIADGPVDLALAGRLVLQARGRFRENWTIGVKWTPYLAASCFSPISAPSKSVTPREPTILS